MTTLQPSTPARSSTRRPRLLLILHAACAACVSGCLDSNSRTTLGDGVVLETFTAPMFPDPRAGPARPDDGPSLVGLDRQNWMMREFLVPVDGTHHRPRYATPLRETDVTARHRNEYPTLLSSLHLDGIESGDEAGEQRWSEAFWAPLHGLWEMLLIPVGLVMDPQCRVHVSPAESYERRPANARRLAAPALHPKEEPLRQRVQPVEGASEPGA